MTDLIIATNRNMYNAFGIRSHYIAENFRKISKSKVYIRSLNKLLPLMESDAYWREKCNILILCPSTNLNHYYHDIRGISKGKIGYCTASAGIWEQPKWATDIRGDLDFLFIGCAGPNDIELNCCEDLKLNYHYTPFGVDSKLFSDKIKFEDKLDHILIEDDNNGKDDPTFHINTLKHCEDNGKRVLTWNHRLREKIPNLLVKSFSENKTPFTEQYKFYRTAKMFMNGVPQMQEVALEWFPGKPHLANMAIYDNRVLEAMASGCLVFSVEGTYQPELYRCKWSNDKIFFYEAFYKDLICTEYQKALYRGRKIERILKLYNSEIFDSCLKHAKNYDWKEVWKKFWVHAIVSENLL